MRFLGSENTTISGQRLFLAFVKAFLFAFVFFQFVDYVEQTISTAQQYVYVCCRVQKYSSPSTTNNNDNSGGRVCDLSSVPHRPTSIFANRRIPITLANAQYIKKRVSVKVRTSSRGSVVVIGGGGGGGGGPAPPAIPPPLANGPLPPELRKEMAKERTVREREVELYGPNGLEKRKNLPRPDLTLPRMECELTDMAKLLALVERRPNMFVNPSGIRTPDSAASVPALGSNKGLKFSPNPYTPGEAFDGRHPTLYNAGNNTLSYVMQADNVCGFQQLRPYRDVFENFFTREHAALKRRTVLVLGDSVLRNQILGAVAAACNPFLMFNCSKRHFHMFNFMKRKESAYGFSTDFPNGPTQCFLNGTEMSDFSPGGGAEEGKVSKFQEVNRLGSAEAPESPRANSNPTSLTVHRLPFVFDPATSAIANKCDERLIVRSVIIDGLTHTKHSFTKAERRQDWHKAFPAPLLEITFVDSNTTFILVDVHCHKRSHIGAFLSNLGRSKRLWPARWNGHIDLVIANGGLHCARKLLVPFYRGIPEGIELLRQVTNGYDGRPTEFIYYESPKAFLIRPPTHGQVDDNDIKTKSSVVREAVKQAHGHLFPTRFFTPDSQEPLCEYTDPLHPAAECVASTASSLYEAIRYIYSRRSIVSYHGSSSAEKQKKKTATTSDMDESADPQSKDGTDEEDRSSMAKVDAEADSLGADEDDAPLLAEIDVDVVKGDLSFDNSAKSRRIQRQDVKKRRPVVGDGSSGIRVYDFLSVDNIINGLLVLAALGFSAVLVFEVASRRRRRGVESEEKDSDS